jgi:hypothetical protein
MSTASLRSPPLAPEPEAEPEPEPEPEPERWTRGLPPLVSGADYAALGGSHIQTPRLGRGIVSPLDP